MRKSSTSAFTLLEMLTVLAIIVILSGIVLNIAGFVQKKSALSRSKGEISMIEAACESYKVDNGSYPRDVPSSGSNSSTDLISPKQNFVSTDPKYAASSLFLYMELSGDRTTAGQSGGKPDGIPDDGAQCYLKELDTRILNTKKDPTTKKIIQVNFLQDPFGSPYAYSTAVAKVEADFQTQIKLGKTNVTRVRGNALPGFNVGKYDLWSTAGNATRKAGDTDDMVWAKWVKNW